MGGKRRGMAKTGAYQGRVDGTKGAGGSAVVVTLHQEVVDAVAPRVGVSGGIKLGHHSNTPQSSIVQQFADILLSVDCLLVVGTL